jgi:hypothetical protein
MNTVNINDARVALSEQIVKDINASNRYQNTNFADRITPFSQGILKK